jgi:mRNA-degrading endonuclease YafQ of YafQ-DinJ toxin-antitoxin module
MEEKIGAVQLTRRFERAYRRKPEDLRQALKETVVRLKADPSYPSLRVKKIRGIKDVWEASIDMKHRMTFEYSPDGIILRNCNGHEALARP